MKKVFLSALTWTLMVSNLAWAGNGDVDSAGSQLVQDMSCMVSYGSGQNLVELQINLSSKNGKVIFMYVFDEAKRGVTFAGKEITNVGQTIYGENDVDVIGITIPSQNPLSDNVTAYVHTFSKTLNARIPITHPAKALCTKD